MAKEPILMQLAIVLFLKMETSWRVAPGVGFYRALKGEGKCRERVLLVGQVEQVGVAREWEGFVSR